MRRAVDELNALAENGAGEVVRRRDGSHGFAAPSMTLSFWSDGLRLDGSALRPYGARGRRLSPRPPRRFLPV